jgi:hypothetical protein
MRVGGVPFGLGIDKPKGPLPNGVLAYYLCGRRRKNRWSPQSGRFSHLGEAPRFLLPHDGVCMSEQNTTSADLVGVPDVAIAKGWSYARAYDAVLRREFGTPVRIDRRLFVSRQALEAGVGIGSSGS